MPRSFGKVAVLIVLATLSLFLGLSQTMRIIDATGQRELLHSYTPEDAVSVYACRVGMLVFYMLAAMVLLLLAARTHRNRSTEGETESNR
jgi:hypothetical protein